ncbi:hypothetical protein JOF48_001646 [Arthrobacter stackebrandtii]|uniref:Carbohydrate-binding domain-containing protein n=1 Tax=Arthrobacter stackebrandtii TaxID=272161 RepID=A0ABS4YVM0_9MICC|nr:carbohydrate-binding domain-containing protein [Arthrobacter stackebrandtii]MBP2412847.1 hypothetical protein [Arthrobacter stackebrandtii]PYH01335.1 hypothetical protein CVV67_07210 [Arthrobacter stackebrandtii]
MKFLPKAKQVTSVAAFALALALAGCSSASTGTTPVPTSSATSSAADAAGTATDASAASGAAASGTSAELAASIADATHFDDDDLAWDAATETSITLANGSGTAAGANAANVAVHSGVLTISAGGTYRISGSLDDGSIVVAAADDVVRIVLDDANISSATGPVVDIQSANEVLLYLAGGTANTLSDGSSYANTATDAPNAAVYSKADLTIAGPGSLTVHGNYADGVVSQDGLVLASGTVTVDAIDDGIKGKDYLALLDGSYTVKAGDDGVKSTNDTDADRGWLLLAGGSLNVAAGDDGIKAATTLTISGGTATVAESNEGLEAAHIAISGGIVNVTSSDDGINAAGGSSTGTGTAEAPADAPVGGMGRGMGGGMDEVGDFSLDISGGAITVNADGDGLDSNGNATISGGTVVVNGPTTDGNGALDVNGDLTVTGGTLTAVGSAGMAVAPSDSSSQSGLQFTFDSTIPSGTTLNITDSSGAVVAAFVTAKAASSLVFTSPDISAGAQYTVNSGGSGATDGATQLASVTAGDYTTAPAPGRR